MKILIIGNGIAGNQVAFKIREKQRDAEITIVSAEDYPEYDPCCLPYFLSGQVPYASVFKKSIRDYETGNIHLVLNHKVVSINPDAKSIKTAKGDEFSYDKLVLAHGGDLFVPPIQGIDTHGVFSCKQLMETERLNAHQGSRAVVIGSGAIGIEAAEALKKKGYVVSIVEMFDWIMPALFDRKVAHFLASELNGLGIRVFTGEKVLGIEGKTRVQQVATDKQILPCDTVVIATGVIPGLSLPRTAGIEVQRGIKVNQRMETSLPDIFACGDCVETIDACTGEDAMFQLKHNAIDQATIVAGNITGENVLYPGAYAFARIHFFNIHAASFGKTVAATQCVPGELEIIEKKDTDGYLRLIIKEDLVVGVQAIGTYANYMGFFIPLVRRRDSFRKFRNKWMGAGSPAPCDSWTNCLIGMMLSS